MSARGAMCGPQAQTDAAVGAFPCVHAPTLPRDAMPPVCGAVSSTGCPHIPVKKAPQPAPPTLAGAAQRKPWAQGGKRSAFADNARRFQRGAGRAFMPRLACGDVPRSASPT